MQIKLEGVITSISFSREMRPLSVEEIDFDTLSIYTVPHSKSEFSGKRLLANPEP